MLYTIYQDQWRVAIRLSFVEEAGALPFPVRHILSIVTGKGFSFKKSAAADLAITIGETTAGDSHREVRLGR
jgi:hypothetical protein